MGACMVGYWHGGLSVWWVASVSVGCMLGVCLLVCLYGGVMIWWSVSKVRCCYGWLLAWHVFGMVSC